MEERDDVLTHEEQAVVDRLRERIRKDDNLSSAVSDEMVVQFLMARKFEEDRAYELLLNSLRWRRERGIGKNQPMTAIISKELKAKRILTPPLSRDKEGSQVVYYRPGMAKKHTVKPHDFCLSVYYLLQQCIHDPRTQRQGFLFVCDLRNTKLFQLDRKLIKSILDMLSNKFPARLKKVLLLEPPGFFNIAFRIIRSLIPSKYVEKLAIARFADLPMYVDADKLLPEYGGTLQFDQNVMVDVLYSQESQQAHYDQECPPQQQVLTPNLAINNLKTNTPPMSTGVVVEGTGSF
jgi:hypothetical protein